MKHVVSFSGGGGSWGAAKRVVERHGTANLALLFTDTLVEDADLYRFLIEGAANVFGVGLHTVAHLALRASTLPPVRRETMNQRKAELASLRADTMAALPGLVWIAEGRTPWETFRDARFIGNTQVDVCSRILKREMSDAWLVANCDPAATVCYVGIDWTEIHRYEGDPEPPEGEPKPKGWRPGLRRRAAAKGWDYRAPLCELPLIAKPDVFAWMAREGLRRPSAYDQGYPHANCGGACVKAGQAQWAMLLDHDPGRFAYEEGEEGDFQALVGKPVTVLRDRRAGESKPLSLRAFRERVQSGAPFDLFEFGGCGCFVDAPEAEQ